MATHIYTNHSSDLRTHCPNTSTDYNNMASNIIFHGDFNTRTDPTRVNVGREGGGKGGGGV